jgi:hypothetical protein
MEHGGENRFTLPQLLEPRKPLRLACLGWMYRSPVLSNSKANNLIRCTSFTSIAIYEE